MPCEYFKKGIYRAFFLCYDKRANEKNAER